MKYTVYALVNQDKRIYVGFTKNLIDRLKYHNSGKVFSTKGYRPWKVLYQEEVSDRIGARRREKYLKGGSGKEFLKSLCRGSSVG